MGVGDGLWQTQAGWDSNSSVRVSHHANAMALYYATLVYQSFYVDIYPSNTFPNRLRKSFMTDEIFFLLRLRRFLCGEQPYMYVSIFYMYIYLSYGRRMYER